MSEAHIPFFISFIFTALRLSTPLSYAALGGYCSERSGTINIALEGMMLIGSFGAAAVALHFHSPLAGLLAGIICATTFAALHAFLCIQLGSDQIISGVAINLLAAGVPPVVCKALYDSSGGTPGLESVDRIQPWFGVSPLVIGAFFLAALFYVMHKHSKLGQYLRFAGEHPYALESQGISLRKIRWIGVLLSGVCCGFAGAYLSIDHGGGFSRNMTAGRGFMALAALIIGRWTPLGAFIASLAFGAIEATQMFLQGTLLPNGTAVPVQWIQMIPYFATLFILAGFVGSRFGGRIRPPKALGITAKAMAFALIVLSMPLLQGCTVPDQAIDFFNKNIGQSIGVHLQKTLAKVPEKKKPEQPEDVDAHRKVNAEFITELFHVVLQRDLRGANELNKYMNVMDQGGSLEGIYNGIVYAQEYRDKEKGVAPAGVLREYSDIMARILLDQKYDPLIIKSPDQKPDVPKVDADETPPQPTEVEKQGLVSQIVRDSITMPSYMLKQKLGEEVLKTIDLKKDYREKLATWYGRFVVYLNKKGIDFGLQQRNITDEYYHYKWALDADEDRLKWECLNRIHVILNYYNK